MSQFALNKNGITADVGADSYAAWVKGLLPSSGIVKVFDDLACARVNDNLVRLSPGVYNLSGYILGVAQGTTADLAVDSGTAGYNRIDLLIAEFVRNGGGAGIDTLAFRILKGTSTTGVAVAPTLTQEDINGTGVTRQEALYQLNITGTTLAAPARLATILGNIDSITPDAVDVVVADSGGYFTGANAETVLQEVGANLGQIATLDSIFTRDILRIKMRQTGLNLDPNAWSDTLEDNSGINDAASTGYDSGISGKLMAVKYSTKYTADVIPSAATPAWTLSSSNGSDSVSGGILTFRSGSSSGNRRAYEMSEAGILANKTKELAFRAKMTSGYASPTPTSAGFRILIFEGTRQVVIAFTYDGRVHYQNSSSATVNLASGLDFSSNYFNAKIILNNTDGLSVYVNDVLVGTVAYSSLQPGGGTIIGFDATAQTTGVETTALIDHIYYTLDNTADATVVWDAQASSGTLKNAVVEAIESLGTGSITYYISRDSGATFTACTLDTVTDISAQPSGTSIVLKAVISGNAELLAVAWGGQA